jgi:uncharacterized membrane protein
MVPPTPPSPFDETVSMGKNPDAPPKPVTPVRFLLGAIRTQVVGGLVLALPIVLTFWILYWLFTTFTRGFLDPLAQTIGTLFHFPLAQALWWKRFVNPLIALGLTVGSLYFLGLAGRTWVSRLVDRILLNVPVVTTIYKALTNVFQSLGNQFQSPRQQRVVLVDFPHPGTRALAFVTNSLQDTATGKTILSVCVLTGVCPPAGFTLFVPEESVTEVGWSVNQSLQVIISGGITAPATIAFHHGLVDDKGRPLARHREAEEASLPR